MKTYYARQKFSLDDKYYIYDINNKPYLEITSGNRLLTAVDRLLGSIFTLGNTFYIKSMDDKELLTIKKKFGFLRAEFDLYTKENNIANIKQHLLALKPTITIDADSSQYLVEGDLMARNFTIYKDNKIIARANKAMFDLKDSYEIDIFEDDDELIAISLLIVIDNSMHN